MFVNESNDIVTHDLETGEEVALKLEYMRIGPLLFGE
jgi:hypothetical protein